MHEHIPEDFLRLFLSMDQNHRGTATDSLINKPNTCIYLNQEAYVNYDKRNPPGLRQLNA